MAWKKVVEYTDCELSTLGYEFLGTFLFCFITGLALSLNLIATPIIVTLLVIGIAVFIGSDKYHLNPGLSWTVWISGSPSISSMAATALVTAQYAGGALAGALIPVFFKSERNTKELQCTDRNILFMNFVVKIGPFT